MYTAFYQLNLEPFRLTPDPQFFYASRTHNRGLSYLRYAFQQHEGFVIITGAPGTGKTELMLSLINGLPQNQVLLAKFVSSNLHANDLLEIVATSFLNIAAGTSKGVLLKKLENFFLSQARAGKHILLLIDEAHNLSTKALIELSMLSNFQLNAQPVVQCFLLGQEVLEDKLAQPQLAHLKQRVIASTHLRHFDTTETRRYIEHRLKVAGWQNDPQISESAYQLIYSFSSGLPRRINTICNRVLLEGYLENKHHIDADIVLQIIEELREDDVTGQTEPPLLSMPLEFEENRSETSGELPKHDTPAAIPITAVAEVKSTHVTGTDNVVTKHRQANTITPMITRSYLSSANPVHSSGYSTIKETTTTRSATAVKNEPAELELTLENNHIPNNVHALFAQPMKQPQDNMQAQTGNDVNNTATENPISETQPHNSETEDKESPLHNNQVQVRPQFMQQILRETSESREPFASHHLLAGFPISRIGWIIGATAVFILWWLIYGSGAYYIAKLIGY